MFAVAALRVTGSQISVCVRVFSILVCGNRLCVLADRMRIVLRVVVHTGG